MTTLCDQFGYPIHVEKVDRFYVVRDDMLPGGSKRRGLRALLKDADEYVYAGPVQGYAQIALAYACADVGKKATVFVAQRNVMHERTALAQKAGAKIIEVPCGYLSNVQAKARAYCLTSDATLLPFGLDDPAFVEALAVAAKHTMLKPREVWSVAGSGCLTRSLQAAWPNATFHAVLVGKLPPVNPGFFAVKPLGRAKAWVAPEKYEQPAKQPPPFPSCDNYDAKAWRFVLNHAKPGAMFWNVGS